MGMAPNPGIWGETVRKGLNPEEELAAEARESSAERAALDAAELRELEHVELYGPAPAGTKPSRFRVFIDWLLRRST